MLPKSRLPAIKLLTPLVHPSAQTLVVVSAAECRWFAIFSKVEPKLSPPLLFLRLGWKAAKASCFDSDRMLVGPSSPFSFFPQIESSWRWSFDWRGAKPGHRRAAQPHTPNCSSSVMQRWLSMSWCFWSAGVTNSSLKSLSICPIHHESNTFASVVTFCPICKQAHCEFVDFLKLATCFSLIRNHSLAS